MIGIAYFFTFLNYVFYCASRFQKKKKHILLFDLLAKVVTVIGLACLGSLTGAYNMAVSFVLLIAAYAKERLSEKKDRKALWVIMYLLFELVYVVILYRTYAGIPSILVFITCSVTLVCVWWLPPQKMRTVGACNSGLFMFYQLSIQNWPGLLELAVIASNVIAYRRNQKSDPLSEMPAGKSPQLVF